jgi:PBP1b-binding outer membrane lipoprotein LpoB
MTRVILILLLILLLNNCLSYYSYKHNMNIIRKNSSIRKRSIEPSLTSLSSAKEALDLMHYGHQSQFLSVNMTWFILITSAYLLQYKIFKLLASK